MLVRVARSVGIGSAIVSGVYLAFPRGGLQDFAAFVLSGQALNAGQPPYAALNASGYPNLAPPILLPLWSALARLDPFVAFAVWWVVQLALFAALVGLLVWRFPVLRGWRVLWLFSVAGLWQTLWLGNIYVPIALAALGAWLLLGKRPVLAGILIGLVVSLKPTFLLWPLLLLASGEVLTVLSATLVAGFLAVIPALLYGPLIYRDWLQAAAKVQSHELLLAFGPLGYLLTLAVILGAVGWIRHSQPDLHAVSTFGIGLSLLLLPWSGLGYLLLLLPAFGRRWSWPLTLAAGLLAVPFPIDQFTPVGYVMAALVLAQPMMTAKLRAWDVTVPAGLGAQRSVEGGRTSAKGWT